MTGKPITNKQAAEIRRLRASGLSYKRIAEIMGVSSPTVQRHVSEDLAEKQREWERQRYARIKADPARHEADRERRINYMRKYMTEYRSGR